LGLGQEVLWSEMVMQQGAYVQGYL
jgi:hypothetical protein